MKTALAVTLILTLGTASSANAQAWTPAATSGTVWVSFQALHVDAHFPSDEIIAFDVDVRATSLTLGVDYGLTDRLAISGQLPYVSVRFEGGDPHVGSIVDDGRMHHGPTDFLFGLRYKAVDSAVVLTPAVTVLIPSANYETFGHAAVGRGLNEYAAGFDAGYNAAFINPRLFIGASYRYTYVDRIDEHITVDRSNADVQLDYVVTARFAVSAASAWQRTHGGLDLPLAPHLKPEHGHHHDQLARANFWHASLGASYSMTETVDIFGSWSRALQGVNTHRFQAFSAGVAWHFDRTRLHRKLTGAGAPPL